LVKPQRGPCVPLPRRAGPDPGEHGEPELFGLPL